MELIMFEFIFGIAVVIASGLLGFKGDRWSGDGRKLEGMFALGLAIALPVWTGMAFTWGLLEGNKYAVMGWMLGSYLLSIVAGLGLRRWMLWGATFMHNERKPKEKGHGFTYDLAERLTGFKWDTCGFEQLVILKMTMWMVGHATWGMGAALLIGVANATIVPLFVVVLIGLVRAYIYRLEFLQNSATQIDDSEPKAGLMTYALLAVSRM